MTKTRRQKKDLKSVVLQKKPQTLPSIDWFTILENMKMTNIDALIQAQVSVNALKPALNWDDASLGLSFPKLGFGKGIHLPYGT